MSFFRKTKNLPSSTETLNEPGVIEVRKARFSLFRANGRRSGVVTINRDPALMRKVKRSPSPPTPSSRSSSGDGEPSSSSSSEESSSSEGTAVSEGGDVADARNRALSILEGRAAVQSNPTPAPAPASTSEPASVAASPTPSRTSQDSNRESTGGETITPAHASLLAALSGRSRRGSGGSTRQSLSFSPAPITPDGTTRRASSRLSLVPENSAVLAPALAVSAGGEGEVDELGLPTYASAAYPSLPATYRFAQKGPFAMAVTGDGEETGLGRYHVSVGVNVWAPKASVTVVRRGLGEDGPVVAQIEWGGSTVPATITVGNTNKALKDVLSKNLVNGSRMYIVGDGTVLQWKMNRTHWKVHVDSTHLATFIPVPPRKLVVLPQAHRFLDHLLISVLLLMRERDETSSRPASEYGMVAVMPYM